MINDTVLLVTSGVAGVCSGVVSEFSSSSEEAPADDNDNDNSCQSVTRSQ